MREKKKSTGDEPRNLRMGYESDDSPDKTEERERRGDPGKKIEKYHAENAAYGTGSIDNTKGGGGRVGRRAGNACFVKRVCGIGTGRFLENERDGSTRQTVAMPGSQERERGEENRFAW